MIYFGKQGKSVYISAGGRRARYCREGVYRVRSMVVRKDNTIPRFSALSEEDRKDSCGTKGNDFDLDQVFKVDLRHFVKGKSFWDTGFKIKAVGKNTRN